MKYKRTKIVATLGPATSSQEKIRQLVKAGVNVFRLNFSHGTHRDHGKLIRLIKNVRKDLKEPVGILQDLSGPKIRVGIIAAPPLQLNVGDELILNAKIKRSHKNEIPLNYPGFVDDVKAKDHLLLADGNIDLVIKRIDSPRVFCKVVVGGSLTSAKGINYPGGSFNIPALTKKDINDLKFGLDNGIDMVALSFVKTVEDIQKLKKVFKSVKRSVPIIAKIEKHEAIRNFFDILKAVDGIMVARGDLGLEIPSEQVPMVQKKLIRLANIHGKPVITATQMLLSMVESPRPTRAEITDVANAILDGTDAVMLSEETAVGDYPAKAVEVMSRIAIETEKNFPYYSSAHENPNASKQDIPQAISRSAARLAQELNAKLIICPTMSGFTARMISRFRPKTPVYALTPNTDTYHQMVLMWNIIPRVFPMEKLTSRLIQSALDRAHKDKLIKKGDQYVITAGYPFGKGVRTNLIKAGTF
jgi:pyruvate kinase